ncbi:alpha-1,2-mannosyltransferase [Exophiala aquamarina CBS 119918]|uniref:Alpha-1,2-mannosyltransferase n=1 Tax=Exophiala aquamarina CBS 119918 TaxID=1182545 RepID=A0A072PNU5_9EURO|nr:alpha-1,2-mannosyltransferase [Exophiala aquamarina CBS 119918]KEF61018.1 alpha-1,2-mannosyltransferase [Exophiala aquamarina CBS 119918]
MNAGTIKRSVLELVERSQPYIDEANQQLQKSKIHCASAFKSAQRDIQRLSQQPYFRETSYALLLFVFAILAVSKYLPRRHQRALSERPSTPTVEKAPYVKRDAISREPGTWPPSSFRRPTPPPYPDWSIESTKPLPYRPFRYKYFQTMGLRSVKYDDWIELDNHYPRFHADKSRRIIERGPKCCRTSPEAYPAAVELLEELSEYLCDRYPTLYQRTDKGVKNLWSGEELDTTSRPLPEDPMQTCARLTQDDLAIMIEKPDGQYYLLAGAILLAGFWRLEDKIGMPLSEIHTSGDVPQFREKLEKGMMNFFRRLKPEELVARNNYFLQVDEDLAWSHSIGSEDSDGISWNTAEQDRAIEHHYFRSERQTLRRLPKSGGVVFTIRTYFHPVTDIAEEDYVPGRLASAVRSWGDDVSRYKGKEKYQNVLLAYLDKKHQEQLDRGLKVEMEEEVRTYPW